MSCIRPSLPLLLLPPTRPVVCGDDPSLAHSSTAFRRRKGHTRYAFLCCTFVRADSLLIVRLHLALVFVGGVTLQYATWQGPPGAEWVNELCSDTSFSQFVAMDLRVRLLLVSWSLEQLAGKQLLRYQVKRIAAPAMSEHRGGYVQGDLLRLLRL